VEHQGLQVDLDQQVIFRGQALHMLVEVGEADTLLDRLAQVVQVAVVQVAPMAQQE